MTLFIINSRLWVNLSQVKKRITNLFTKLTEMLNRIELFRLSKVRLFVGGYQLNFQSLLVRLCKGLFFLSRLDKVVDDSACVVVTLESPTERIFGGFEKSNSSCTLF